MHAFSHKVNYIRVIYINNSNFLSIRRFALADKKILPIQYNLDTCRIVVIFARVIVLKRHYILASRCYREKIQADVCMCTEW